MDKRGSPLFYIFALVVVVVTRRCKAVRAAAICMVGDGRRITLLLLLKDNLAAVRLCMQSGVS